MITLPTVVWVVLGLAAALLVLKALDSGGAPRVRRRVREPEDADLPSTTPARQVRGVRVPGSAQDALAAGQKILAIKLLREAHRGMGLKEAKDVIDRLELEVEEGLPEEAPAATPVPEASGRGEVIAGVLVSAEVLRLAREGEVIPAIKQLRLEHPELGLKDAKFIVEQID